MRIADKYLTELIANDGQLQSGPVGNLAVLRLALDLREAREKLAELESALRLRENAPKLKAQRGLRVVEQVTGRFGDPRGDDYEERVEVRERGGKKVDSRA